MRGICFQEIEKVVTCEIPDPEIQEPTDAVVKVELAGLCGSDLHPFFGREVGMDPGTVMGHEFVGTVSAVGNQVNSIKEGDRVCAPFTTSCGSCFYCQKGLTARCEHNQLFGWRSNQQGLHGGQAEKVRVPLADGTLVRIGSEVSDEFALLLGDNLSTGYYCAEMANLQSDGVCVVVGCGTVGLLAILSARELGNQNIFAIDFVEQRLGIAAQLGAKTFSDPESLCAAVKDETDGRGADSVMELVGLPAAQQLAYELVRPGGTISVIGCHCTPDFAFSPVDAYDKNLTYRTGRCSARHYMDGCKDLFTDQQEFLKSLVTHRFQVEQAEKAYDVFANRKDGCIKAVVEI